MNSTELCLSTILNCGTADLCMLDHIYSPLAEECCNIDEIIENNKGSKCLILNYLLFEVYYYIKENIVEEARKIIKDPEDFIADTQITKLDTEYLTKYIKDIEYSEIYTNYLDSYFNCDIDQIIDFDGSVLHNTYELIKYAIDNKK